MAAAIAKDIQADGTEGAAIKSLQVALDCAAIPGGLFSRLRRTPTQLRLRWFL
jgi:hypothetical protein